MQVTAISAAFTGTERRKHTYSPDGEKVVRYNFEDVLRSLKEIRQPAKNQSDDDLYAALQLVLKRMEVLIGADMAHSVVNKDGTINLARFAQLMSGQHINDVTQPYQKASRPADSSMPQLVDMVA